MRVRPEVQVNQGNIHAHSVVENGSPNLKVIMAADKARAGGEDQSWRDPCAFGA